MARINPIPYLKTNWINLMSEKPPTLKPIVLYDHLPGILAGYPAVLFLILALLSLVPGKSIVGSIDTPTFDTIKTHIEGQIKAAGDTNVIKAYEESLFLVSAKTPFFDPHMLFWIGLTVMLVWYIAFRFNLPKGKFFLMFFKGLNYGCNGQYKNACIPNKFTSVNKFFR